jgi:tetratricopeptide (TPR) repeat protein
MKLQEWDRAIFAFGTAISIDESDTEAWGNLANCYHALDRMTEALACTEQALKINRKSWRLWHNCIRFSLACK